GCAVLRPHGALRPSLLLCLPRLEAIAPLGLAEGGAACEPGHRRVQPHRGSGGVNASASGRHEVDRGLSVLVTMPPIASSASQMPPSWKLHQLHPDMFGFISDLHSRFSPFGGYIYLQITIHLERMANRFRGNSLAPWRITGGAARGLVPVKRKRVLRSCASRSCSTGSAPTTWPGSMLPGRRVT